MWEQGRRGENWVLMIKDNSTNFEAISPEEFQSELDSGETILIDIRTPEELIKYWTISSTQLHYIYWAPEFAMQILALDTTKKYLIYCWHGHRSAAVRDFMQGNGFIWVKDLKGGIDAWNRE